MPTPARTGPLAGLCGLHLKRSSSLTAHARPRHNRRGTQPLLAYPRRRQDMCSIPRFSFGSPDQGPSRAHWTQPLQEETRCWWCPSPRLAASPQAGPSASPPPQPRGLRCGPEPGETPSPPQTLSAPRPVPDPPPRLTPACPGPPRWDASAPPRWAAPAGRTQSGLRGAVGGGRKWRGVGGGWVSPSARPPPPSPCPAFPWQRRTAPRRRTSRGSSWRRRAPSTARRHVRAAPARPEWRRQGGEQLHLSLRR